MYRVYASGIALALESACRVPTVIIERNAAFNAVRGPRVFAAGHEIKAQGISLHPRGLKSGEVQCKEAWPFTRDSR